MPLKLFSNPGGQFCPLGVKLVWIGCADYLVDPKRSPGYIFFSGFRPFILGKENIEISVPAFFKHNNSSVATVWIELQITIGKFCTKVA